MPHCNSDASPQPSRYAYWLALAVLACLSGALVLSTAALVAQPPIAAPVDAHGNAVVRR